jgi:hypothetical protein
LRKVKRGLGFGGIKGGKKGKEGAFSFGAEIEGYWQVEERLTGLLVGVGNPQHT